MAETRVVGIGAQYWTLIWDVHPKVCAHSGGSALMKEPKLAIEIVKAVRSAISIPHIKIRSGFDADRRKCSGAGLLFKRRGLKDTIHWRTREDGYGARAVDKSRVQIANQHSRYCQWRRCRPTKRRANAARNRGRWCHGRTGSYAKSLVVVANSTTS